MSIKTKLRWRGSHLYTGDRWIGTVWKTPKRWNANFQEEKFTFHPTESAARSALEAAAREALSNG